MKYYLLSLNNNLCANVNDKPSGRYGYASSTFVNTPSRDFRILIKVEIENPSFLFIKSKKIEQDWHKKINVKVLGFEQNGKMYDAITRKEIIYADEKQAHGESNTYFDCLTYSVRRELSDEKLANTVKCFLDNEENVAIYASCIRKVEAYNHACYLKTAKLNKEKENELVRARSIVDEFQRKYGQK